VLLRCRRCIYAAAVVLVAAQIAALPLLPISTLPLLLFLRCCPCHRRRCCYTATRLRDAAVIDVGLLLTAQGLPPWAALQLQSAARCQLEGLGFSPKAHPLPPLARTLCCLVLVGSPLNFAGYLLRDGRELRQNRTGF
jgi:hypothetical protein